MRVESDIDIFGPAVEDVPMTGVSTAPAIIDETPRAIGVKTLADGTQVPVNLSKVMSNEDLVATLSNSVRQNYEGKDPRHVGKTKLQAGMDSLVDKFASGDKDAAVIVMDRLGGKPAQITKQLTLNTDLSTFLESCR